MKIERLPGDTLVAKIFPEDGTVISIMRHTWRTGPVGERVTRTEYYASCRASGAGAPIVVDVAKKRTLKAAIKAVAEWLSETP